MLARSGWMARPHRMTARREGMEKKGMSAIHPELPPTRTTDIQGHRNVPKCGNAGEIPPGHVPKAVWGRHD